MQLSRWLQFVSAWILSSLASCLAAGDFFGSLGRDAVQAASAQLDAVRDDANRLLAEGRPAESMAKFEDAFPAANRTAV